MGAAAAPHPCDFELWETPDSAFKDFVFRGRGICGLPAGAGRCDILVVLVYLMEFVKNAFLVSI